MTSAMTKLTLVSLYLIATPAWAFLSSPKLSLGTSREAHHHSLVCTSRVNDDDDDDGLMSSRRSFVSWVATGSGVTIRPTFAEAKDLKEEYRQGTAALSDMDSDAPVPREAYRKLSSGVVYADLGRGSGDGSEVVKEGSRVNLQWVLRKSNGYFVDSSERNDNVPFIFAVGDGNAIQGVDEGIRGMRVNGVRRLLIPPSLAYVQGLEDGKPGPLPVGFGPRQQIRRVQEVRKNVPGEYIFLEVKLTRLR